MLFTTCFVEYSEAETGRAAVQVLEHNGVACRATATRPAAARPSCTAATSTRAPQRREGRRRLAHRACARGKPVVVPGPTCSYQLKNEYPELLSSDDARLVAENTFDLGEYLWKLRAKTSCSPRVSRRPLGRVAYHLPCHLKSQNIGFRSRSSC